MQASHNFFTNMQLFNENSQLIYSYVSDDFMLMLQYKKSKSRT